MRRILAAFGCVLALFLVAPSLNGATLVGAPLQVEQERPAFFIIGAVQRPGKYDLPAGLTVGQGIDQAGGLTARGNLSDAIIARLVDGKKVTVPAKVEDIVLHNDTIYIPPRR